MDIDTFRDYCLAKKAVTEHLPFDPEKAIPEDCIEILIEHFIYHEEYEKCAELVKSQKLINETYEMIEQNKKRIDNN